MRKDVIQKMIKVLESAVVDGDRVCLKRKDYEYLMERLESELKSKEKKHEADEELQKVASYFFARKWINPINRGRLIKEVKELFIPYLKESGISYQEIPFVMDYYFKQRSSSKFVYKTKDAHLFIRFFGEVYSDYKKTGKKEAGIGIAIPEL